MKALKSKVKNPYGRFGQLDGDHPLKDQVPESHVQYLVRARKGGQVRYFNFDLAKQMGLIPANHDCQIDEELSDVILKTFSLLIINEYDIQNKIPIKDQDVAPKKYMATRYLQLQHPNKQGKTSGDGRSIWNGVVTHNGKTWDVSSGGTGATCLSPATHIYGKYFQSGDPTISYGCGLAEVDEGIGAMIFSEIFYGNQIKTERVLTIIEFKDGISINVRAHENLIRPSHFFAHLKQGNHLVLRKLADYYIEREKKDHRWPKQKLNPYDQLLEQVSRVFGRTAALFEDEYIFCWLDWDGDNILMDGGIIDYGSVRQFGLFHHEYRYDDVDRYSTNLLEQKGKARQIVQTFAQLIDFIKTGKKRPLSDFKDHESLQHFESHFHRSKQFNLLKKMGFKSDVCRKIIAANPKVIERFRKVFQYFERAKSSEGLIQIEDGITWNAIFCLRDLLRELPQIYLSGQDYLPENEFLEILKSQYATQKDLELTTYRKKQIKLFQKYYLELLSVAQKVTHSSKERLLLEVVMRSSVINKYDRITGNAVIYMVDEIVKNRKKIDAHELYKMVKDFCHYQNFNPDQKFSYQRIETKHKRLIHKMIQIVKEHREDI